MLSVCRKSECRKGNANRGARKSCALRQKRKYNRQQKHQIEICQNTKSVYAKVDKARRHAEFIGKVKPVARTVEKRAIIAKTASVEQKAEQFAKCKQDNKEDIHKRPINVSYTLVILGVLSHCRFCRGNTERFVEEAVNKNAEYAKRKTCFIHIVAAVHRRHTGEERGNKKACNNAERNREDYTQNAEFTDFERASGGIKEQEVAYEGRERG